MQQISEFHIAEGDLSKEELLSFESNWNFIKKYHSVEEHVEEEKGRYALYKMGRKILPLIVEDLKDYESHKFFEASELISALAEEEDLETVLGLLERKDVLSNPDGSVPHNLMSVLRVITKSIRESNEHDGRLDGIANRLLDIYDDHANEMSKILSHMGLALTGTEAAKQFLNQQTEEVTLYSEVLQDVSNTPSYWATRRKILSPEEMREIANSNSLEHASLDDWEDEEHMPSLWEEAMDPTERMLAAKEIVESVRQREWTAREAMYMYTFNFLRNHPDLTSGERETLLQRLKKISDKEKLYKDPSVPLPTMGNELEIPRFVDALDKRIIDGFGLSNYRDGDWHQLFEINKGYSYSPDVQSRVLEELFKLRVLPITQVERYGQKIWELDKDEMLSLHLNFGVPKEIEGVLEEYYKGDINNLVDALVFAFVSPNRIKKRKTRGVSWNLKTNNVGTNERTGTKRLEIKVTEFADFPTFRMNKEAQELVGAMFAHVKMKQGIQITRVEEEMGILWEMFRGDLENVKREFQIPTAIYNDDRNRAVELAKNPHLRSRMRKLVDTYSQVVRETIFGKEE